jgi:hypothetical protein
VRACGRERERERERRPCADHKSKVAQPKEHCTEAIIFRTFSIEQRRIVLKEAHF